MLRRMRTIKRSRRNAFTLLEMVFAVTIGTMVMVGAGTLLVAIQRNERAIARRAEDAAALGRIRQVMQRSFSTVLMAPTPSGRSSAPAVATPAGQAPVEGVSQNAADRNRGSRVLDEARATTPPRILLARAGSALALSAASIGASDVQVNQPVGNAPAGFSPLDGSFSTASMSASSVLQLPAGPPQRLELVLIDPPVPTQQRDTFALAKVVRKVAQERLARAELARQKQAKDGPAVAEAVPVSADESEEEQDPEGMNDVRAVRGAFELRPQPLTDAQNARLQAGDADAPPQLFELWWIPERARRTVQQMREMSRAARIVEEAGMGDPFRIAGNIKAARWRMFDDGERRDEYAGVFRQDLPAYVEFDIEMASGMVAQWLFEVGLQTGPEAAAPSSTLNARGSDPLTPTGAPKTSPGLGESVGGSKQTPAQGNGRTDPRSIPATPMQPARPLRSSPKDPK